MRRILPCATPYADGWGRAFIFSFRGPADCVGLWNPSEGCFAEFTRSCVEELGMTRLVAGSLLFQAGVFGTGFFQDGDVGVGILPEREEILISDAALGGVAFERIRAGQAELRERKQDIRGG